MAAYGDRDGEAYRDAPISKRPRFDDKDGNLDPHRAPPSPVLHVRSLRETATQEDIIDAVRSFGRVAYVMMLPRKRQALVEFEDIDAAAAVVRFCQASSIYVAGQPAFFNFSTSTTINRPASEPGVGASAGAENKVLLFTIQDAKYPITVEVLHTICSPSGKVVRIVVFKKNGVQAMVEFDNCETARRAKQSLNGCDIYSGCCTLKIEYAKPERLNVYKNDSDSWDYTNPNPGGASGGASGGAHSPSQVLAGERSHQRQESAGATGSSASRYAGGEASSSARGGSARGPADYPSRYDEAIERRGIPDRGNEQRYSNAYDDYPPAARRVRPGFDGASRYPPEEEEYDNRRDYERHGFGGRYSGPMGRGPSGAPPSSGDSRPPEQGAVLMIYNMNMDKFNCDRLFNLLCLYGNVLRVKFLKTKEGVAMVQMADGVAAQRAVANLTSVYAFGNKMSLGFSKQPYLQDVINPHTLIDGSSAYKDYNGTRNNRFSNPDAAAKNRIAPPSKVLHFFNTPASITDEELAKVFENAGARPPLRVKIFPTKNERGCTGLLEWETVDDAVEALILTNHVEIPNPAGKIPYVFKLCFSSSPSIESQHQPRGEHRGAM